MRASASSQAIFRPLGRALRTLASCPSETWRSSTPKTAAIASSASTGLTSLSLLVRGLCEVYLINTSVEILCVDDASGDGTADVVRRLGASAPEVRQLRHALRSGQSAALATGLRAARGAILLTLDADGQNDPADFPALLAALDAGADAACGVRVDRQDGWVRRASSRFGNGFRDLVTGVPVRDAGCALRALRRECLAELPVFNGLHRFIPTLLRLQGFTVVEVPVHHRPRRAGVSKYGIGNRALRGLLDCFVMRWFARRGNEGNPDCS